MCWTPSTSSGTAIGSRSVRSSGSQYELTSTPMFGWGACQCMTPGAISSMARILQQIMQLAGISPDRTTGVLTPSRRDLRVGRAGEPMRPSGRWGESPGLHARG